MKMKARADQDNLILEEDDKTREVIVEHRILTTDTQNKPNGFWMGIKASVVKSENEIFDTEYDPDKSPFPIFV